MSYRDLLRVEEAAGERFELALELVSRGLPFVFRGVAVVPTPNGPGLEVPSSWSEPNRDSAERDLQIALDAWTELRSHGGFAAMSSEEPASLLLTLDYGTGTLVLAEKVAGEIVWRREGPRLEP